VPVLAEDNQVAGGSGWCATPANQWFPRPDPAGRLASLVERRAVATSWIRRLRMADRLVYERFPADDVGRS
jgi:hypothetical protein